MRSPFSRPALGTAPLFAFALVAFPLLGANGGGCSTEYQPGDGGSQSWEVGAIPTPKGDDQPMTCAWLESNNCWRVITNAAVSCAPSTEGAWNADRSSCSFSNGARFELAGPISTPPAGETGYPVVNQRLVDGANVPCFTGKILSIGKTAFASRAGTAVIESKSATTYRVICPDGSSFADDVPGTCENIGARWLAKQAPGYTLTCEGGTTACTVAAWNANPAGAATLVTCK